MENFSPCRTPSDIITKILWERPKISLCGAAGKMSPVVSKHKGVVYYGNVAEPYHKTIYLDPRHSIMHHS